MSKPSAWILTLLLAAPLAATAKPKPAPPSAAQKAEIQKLKAELAQAKEKLAAVDSLEAELETARQSRDAYKASGEGLQKEMDLIKRALKENQSSGDAMLKDLSQAKEAAKTCAQENAKLKAEVQALQAKARGGAEEGALVPLTADVVPARPINLRQVAPARRKTDRGVVVVNVLVNEQGEVTDVRLLQGLPGEAGEWEHKAHEACLDAAKRLVFDPARTATGAKVKVWQGVGFYLD